VESSYLNTDMCKYEWSQSEESKAQSAASIPWKFAANLDLLIDRSYVEFIHTLAASGL